MALVRDRVLGPGAMPYLRELVVFPPDAKGRVVVTGQVLNKILPVRPDPDDPDKVLPAERTTASSFSSPRSLTWHF